MATIQVNPGDDIQSIINNAAPGSTIFFNTGTYEVSNTIQLKSGLTLQGASGAELQATGTNNILVGNGVSNVTVEGLHFDGGPQQIGVQDAQHAATMWYSSNNVNVINNSFTNIQADAAVFVYNGDNFNVSNNTANNINQFFSGHATVGAHDNLTVDSNTITNAGRMGIEIMGTFNDLHVDGNNLSNIAFQALSIVDDALAENSVTIIGNHISNSSIGPQTAIEIAESNMIVADNVIDTSLGGVSVGHVPNSYILNNTFTNTPIPIGEDGGYNDTQYVGTNTIDGQQVTGWDGAHPNGTAPPSQAVLNEIASIEASLGGSGSSTPATDPPPVQAPSAGGLGGAPTVGASLSDGNNGTLTSSDGTWSFGTAADAAGNLILLNGQNAANGFATELVTDTSGHVFAQNAMGSWFEWSNGSWAGVADPPQVPSGSSGSGSSPTVSSDGSTLMVGGQSSLTTSDGTWTFGSAADGDGNLILLNGQNAANGFATELLVSNGHLYAENAHTSWYAWGQGGWTELADPPATGQALPSSGSSAPGTSLTAGAQASLTTGDGTWTFGHPADSAGNLILLNGQSAANGFATELVTDSQNHVFAGNAQGSWYEWMNSGWQLITDPNAHPAAATMSPTSVDSSGHDIFAFNMIPQTPAEIAHFSPGTDVVDLTTVLQSTGYNGTNPIADHVVTLVQSGSSNTAVMVDPTGVDPNHGTAVATLDGVLPQNLHTSDFVFHH